MSDRAGGPELDLSSLTTVPVEGRADKVSAGAFAGPPGDDAGFRAFLDSLPRLLEAESLRSVARAVAGAARDGKPVVWMIGGHVVKTGLAPVLLRLADRKAATVVASNGSAVIHDWEIARWGGTSEDVEAGLVDGTFGMAEETGREMNEAIRDGAERGLGLGEALAGALAARDDLAAPERSLLVGTREREVPFTVHAAVGGDIIHQHPAADGAAIGDTSLRDFRRLAARLPDLDDGGVVLNVGSAVIMPEVFVKALTIARNLNEGRPRRFVTADFDMIRHYRPRMNVVERPTRSGDGTGYQITGHHEIMIPLLAWAVESYLDAPAEEPEERSPRPAGREGGGGPGDGRPMEAE